MFFEIVLQFLTVAGMAALLVLYRHYLPGYAAEKGKNLATKEDIAVITDKIESVKAKYATGLESLRAVIQSRIGINQFRYEREFEILLPLSEKLVELRDATLSLRPEGEYVDPSESEEDRRKRKLSRYSKASRDLYEFSETRRPFVPEELVQSLRELDQIAWREVIQYRHRSSRGEGYDPKYWDNALENATKIQEAAERVLTGISARVRRWERFDPGP